MLLVLFRLMFLFCWLVFLNCVLVEGDLNCTYGDLDLGGLCISGVVVFAIWWFGCLLC